jgi:hypothetical protein
MERYAELIEKLYADLKNGANTEELFVTANLLQIELVQKWTTLKDQATSSKISITMPSSYQTNVQDYEPKLVEKVIEPIGVAEKTVETIVEVVPEKIVLKLDEPLGQVDLQNTINETEETAFTYYEKKEDSKLIIETSVVEKIIDVKSPVAHLEEKEFNDLNDKLDPNTREIGHKLNEAPIVDLRKGIGLNDRFVFIAELFRGDEVMYENSLKTINNFSFYSEAQFWMERELKTKIGWDENSETVAHFYALVKRRFS